MTRARDPRLAVAIHDVEPATYERCALIRDWLADHDVDRVTLLVIPAAGRHPFFQRSPELEAWLLDRRDAGDAIAQHGFMHRRLRPVFAGNPAAEFSGLDASATRERVLAGRRYMAEAGLEPRGFVAPAYAYTAALRRELAGVFDWFATHFRCHGTATPRLTPALGLGASSAPRRVVSPVTLRLAAPFARETMRLDLHPVDFDHARHVHAVERVLERRGRRRAVTYDDLVAG